MVVWNGGIFPCYHLPVTILFVCVGNVSRSQMAAAYFDMFTGGEHEVFGAGTHVGSEDGRQLRPDEYPVQCMREEGIDLSGRRVTQLTPELAERADLVVSLVGRNPLPDVMKNPQKLVVWDVPDPLGMSMDDFRGVRDQIKGLVEKLISEPFSVERV